MDWLANLLTVAGGGVALWLIMGFIVKCIPSLDRNSDLKFALAMALAFVIPVGAYGLEIAFGYTTFTWEGLALSIGVGYTISQGVHKGSEKIRGVA